LSASPILISFNSEPDDTEEARRWWWIYPVCKNSVGDAEEPDEFEINSIRKTPRKLENPPLAFESPRPVDADVVSTPRGSGQSRGQSLGSGKEKNRKVKIARHVAPPL
jgi:hypothetical protein